MEPIALNRFEVFFEEDSYIALKNHLYNYQLRKKAVEKHFKKGTSGLILEVGSGISPVMTTSGQIVYSDFSVTGLQILKRTQKRGWYVAADGVNLPFKSGVFAHTICSEVLEHIADDMAVIKELARVMRPAGHLILTFPHRKFYFALDDRFVNHYRRYELSGMENKLSIHGLMPISTQKVLGPLEKITMCIVIGCISLLRIIGRQAPKTDRTKKAPKRININVLTALFKWANRFYMGLAWLDARIMPRFLATVLLIHATLPDSACSEMPAPRMGDQNQIKNHK